MYRKGTLLIMLALAVTLAAATVSVAAPKETRTVCQDGVTKEIPIQAKAKGATEGPCEAEPVSEAERVCNENYLPNPSTFIPPDTCEYQTTESISSPDGAYRLEFRALFRAVFTPNAGYLSPELVSYEPTRCLDGITGLEVDMNDPNCQQLIASIEENY